MPQYKPWHHEWHFGCEALTHLRLSAVERGGGVVSVNYILVLVAKECQSPSIRLYCIDVSASWQLYIR